jgi:hypothetical protein
LLDEYLCFECEEGPPVGRRGRDGDTTMWNLHEQWRESALKGQAITREEAWAEDDGEVSSARLLLCFEVSVANL